MVPAWAASSLTYSIERCSFWKRVSASISSLRRFEPGGDRCRRSGGAADTLALLGEIALFGVAELADHGLEAVRIEAAADALEVGVAVMIDSAGSRLVATGREPHAARFFIEGGFRDGLLQHLAVEAEGARLVRGQRTAELAAELLQLLGVESGGTRSVEISVRPMVATRGLAEALEDVGDAPNAETDNQNAHHHGHNSLAEPV